MKFSLTRFVSNDPFGPRTNQDGSVDPSFDAGSAISFQTSFLALEPDGKVVVNSSRQPAVLVRLNENGTRDGTFAPDLGQDNLENLLVQPDGKLVLSLYPSQGLSYLARFDTQGARESGFDFVLPYGQRADTLAMQEDGKVLIGGYLFAINDAPVTNLMRVNIDGTIDTTFKTALPIEVVGFTIASQRVLPSQRNSEFRFGQVLAMPPPLPPLPKSALDGFQPHQLQANYEDGMAAGSCVRG